MSITTYERLKPSGEMALFAMTKSVEGPIAASTPVDAADNSATTLIARCIALCKLGKENEMKLYDFGFLSGFYASLYIQKDLAESY